MTSTSKSGGWRVGTITHIMPEALGLRSYMFAFDSPIEHDAGQYYEIRLTAEDGYQAARLYSAAMPANGTSNMLQLTIALMPYGEVSPYIFNNMTVGSQLEIRGPLGRFFTWTEHITEPILLVGGGTGIIPLRAIRLQHQQSQSTTSLALLYSVKTYADMAYKYELFPRGSDPSEDVVMTFTERPPTGWTGYARRIDPSMTEEILRSFNTKPIVYVCGPTPLVEAVTQLLVSADIDPTKIKAERFGPTS